jgi:hypothetical protein
MAKTKLLNKHKCSDLSSDKLILRTYQGYGRWNGVTYPVRSGSAMESLMLYQ